MMGRSSCAWNTWVRPIPGAPGGLPGLRAGFASAGSASPNRQSTRQSVRGMRPFPRCPTARRARTVLRSLVQPVPRFLQVVQQPGRQRPQRRFIQGIQVGAV